VIADTAAEAEDRPEQVTVEISGEQGDEQWTRSGGCSPISLHFGLSSLRWRAAHLLGSSAA
jgi:hypothetical protein